jgi:hypothetical protein
MKEHGRIKPAIIRIAIFSIIGMGLNWIFFRESFNIFHAIFTIAIFSLMNILFELYVKYREYFKNR